MDEYDHKVHVVKVLTDKAARLCIYACLAGLLAGAVDTLAAYYDMMTAKRFLERDVQVEIEETVETRNLKNMI